MAAKATPNIPQSLIPTIIVIANNKIGTIVLKYPKARPYIILMAAPLLQTSANSCTGACELEV